MKNSTRCGAYEANRFSRSNFNVAMIVIVLLTYPYTPFILTHLTYSFIYFLAANFRLE